MYSEKVMDHFQNPRNVGEIEDASGVGTVGNAKCGDIMRMFLDIDENGIIREEALDGLPPVTVHCSLLAEEAIHAALWDYAEKNHITIDGLQKPKNDISEGEEEEDY